MLSSDVGVGVGAGFSEAPFGGMVLSSEVSFRMGGEVKNHGDE